MPTAKLSSMSYAGLAVETTEGTPVAPTGFLPMRTFKPQDVPVYVPDRGLRGQPVDLFGEYASVKSSTYGWDGDAFSTSFGNLLGAIQGLDTVSGTAAPYTHTFTTVASPPSYTLADYYVAGYREWPGSRAEKLQIKFTPQAGVTYVADWLGWPSVVETAPSSFTYATVPFFLGWQAALSLGGSSDINLTSFQVDLARKSSKVLFSAQNSQNPFTTFVGPLEATYTLEFYMEDDTEYKLALSEATQAVVITVTQPNTGDILTLQSSAVQFTKPTIDRQGEYVQVTLDGSAVFNATDNSVFLAKLQNAVSTSYTTTASN